MWEEGEIKWQRDKKVTEYREVDGERKRERDWGEGWKRNKVKKGDRKIARERKRGTEPAREKERD